jgi:hypothetical protein
MRTHAEGAESLGIGSGRESFPAGRKLPECDISRLFPKKNLSTMQEFAPIWRFYVWVQKYSRDEGCGSL